MNKPMIEHPESIPPMLPVHALPPVSAPGEAQHKAMVAEAAYYLAERRDDWREVRKENEALARAAI